MSRARHWASVALENDNADELDLAPADPELAEVPSETVEAQLVEVEGLDHQIESLVDDGEQLSDDMDGMDAVTEVTEAALAEGGLDEAGAKMAEVATESYTGRWNVKAGLGVATENFGSADTRRQATEVALESQEKAKDGLWARFVQWLKGLVEKAKDAWVAYSNAGKALGKRAAKLEAAVKGGLGAMKENEVQGGWAKSLVVDEAMDYAFCLDFAKTSAAKATSAAKEVSTITNYAGKIFREAERAGYENAGLKSGAAFGKKASKALNKLLPKGATNPSVLAFPGSGYLVSFENDGIPTTSFTSFGDKAATDKLPTLDQAGINAAIGGLKELATTLEAKLKDFRTTNEEMGKLADNVASARADVKGKEGDEKKAGQKAVRVARQAILNAKAIEKAVTSSMKACGAGLNGYIAASIKAHEKKAA